MLYHFTLFIMTTSNFEQDYNKTTTFQLHEDKQLNNHSLGIKIEVSKTRKIGKIIARIRKTIQKNKLHCIVIIINHYYSLGTSRDFYPVRHHVHDWTHAQYHPILQESKRPRKRNGQ